MNRFKVESKRYDAIEFYMKSESICRSCLKIMLDGYNWYSISLSDIDQWEKITIPLKDLGLQDNKNEFESFMFQGSSPESQIIYFDQIKLVKSNYEDKGKCVDSDDSDDKQDDHDDQDGQNNHGVVKGKNNYLIFLAYLLFLI